MLFSLHFVMSKLLCKFWAAIIGSLELTRVSVHFFVLHETKITMKEAYIYFVRLWLYENETCMSDYCTHAHPVNTA
jgi:hypothetical protein